MPTSSQSTGSVASKEAGKPVSRLRGMIETQHAHRNDMPYVALQEGVCEDCSADGGIAGAGVHFWGE